MNQLHYHVCYPANLLASHAESGLLEGFLVRGKKLTNKQYGLGWSDYPTFKRLPLEVFVRILRIF